MSVEMKDSGIDWIGEIPHKWSLTRLKFLLQGNLQYGANESGVSYNEYLPRYVRITDIQDNTLRDDITKLSLTEEQAKGYILKDNDILFARSGATVGKAFIYKESYGKCAFAGYLIKASINNNNDARFIYHYTQGLSYDEWKKQVFIQATIQNIGADKYAQLPIPLPTKEEQSRIANFLDKKCAEIDELISLQEQMIAQLNTYKQAVITETVTKGLDSNVEMKDSGVEWIGEIPEHWDIVKLKRKLSLLNGRAYSDVELLEDGKYTILRVGNLFTSDKWYYSNLELDENKYCNNGDLLYAWSASIGPLIWTGEKVIYHYHIWKVLYGKNDIKFAFYMLQALTDAKRQDMHGSAMQHLTKSNMDNSWCAFPPLSEQQSIAQYLDQKCKEIDELISIKKEKIEHLKAYKKSVIYEYVTGKKQVSDN